MSAGPNGTGLAADDLYLLAHSDVTGKPLLQPRNGDGTMPEPDIEEVRAGLEEIRQLRLALDLLAESLPPRYVSAGLEAELWALREKLAAAELTQLRKIGQREYLIIQPLAPTTAEPPDIAPATPTSGRTRTGGQQSVLCR